jgi:serine/threonine protein kinase
MLRSLAFLRRNKILHCDLKPENILLPPATLSSATPSPASASGNKIAASRVVTPADFHLTLIDFGSSSPEVFDPLHLLLT